jgi:selenocysteine lyase/cysteine desulfurase
VFAPHMGFAWCRRESINRLPTFREHFIPDVTPDKLEAGTYVYENVAGMAAAIGYLETLGDGPTRRERLSRAMTRIAEYERTLSQTLLIEIGSLPSVRVYGVTDAARLAERVPTLAFSVDGRSASFIAEALASRDIGVRSGHMYSPRLIARLGRADGGVVRSSLVHYNTVDEIARFRAALDEIIDRG